MPRTHTIADKETLSGIAQTYGTDVATLAKLNNIADPNKIYAGATLKLPDAPKPEISSNPAIQGILGGASNGIATSEPIRSQETLARVNDAKTAVADNAELTKLTRQKQIADLKASLGIGDAPATPDLVSSYNTLADQKGVNALNSKIATLKQQEQALQDEFKQFNDSQQGLGRTQGFVDATVSAKGKEIQARLDSVRRDRQLAVDELSAATNTIATIMDLTKTDYANARSEYEKDFSNAISLINATKGDQTAQDQAADNARANLQIISNRLAAGDLTSSSLTPEQQTQISQLELKAGLPIGITAAIRDANPKGDILTTSTRTEGGVKYLDAVMRDKATGALSTQTISLGKDTTETESGNATDAQAAIGLYEGTIQQAIDQGASPAEAVIAASTIAQNTGTKLGLSEQGALLQKANELYGAKKKPATEQTPSTPETIGQISTVDKFIGAISRIFQ
jgi:murein DD-endopeptidase MepM/ murein hydrolase activator NlpD